MFLQIIVEEFAKSKKLVQILVKALKREAKRYLKTDYKLLISCEKDCTDHC